MSLSQSSFYKWRCLIALASVDAKIDPGERKFFSEQLNNLKDEGISREQMQTLSDDLKNPKQPEVFFIRVDDPIEKIDLLRMAYYLFMSDDEFEIREKQVYEHLKTEIAKQIGTEPEVLDKIAKLPADKFNVSIKDLIRDFIEKNLRKKA